MLRANQHSYLGIFIIKAWGNANSRDEEAVNTALHMQFFLEICGVFLDNKLCESEMKNKDLKMGRTWGL